MFNIDFKDIIYQLVPHFLRKENLLKYIFSGIKTLKDINNDGVVVESLGQQNSSLYQFQLFIRNFLNFDSRTIYLQKYLNDIYGMVTEEWDEQTTYVIGDKIVYDAQNYISLTGNANSQPDTNPADWGKTGIVIVNDNTIHVLYLFQEAEERDPVYFYNNWDATIAYIIDDFAVTDNKVYQANTNNTNEEPPNAKWDFIKDITFVFNFEDELPFDYRVEIPFSVTLQPDYSHDRIKSQIRLFNAAGRSFEGVEKGNITNQFFNSLT